MKKLILILILFIFMAINSNAQSISFIAPEIKPVPMVIDSVDTGLVLIDTTAICIDHIILENIQGNDDAKLLFFELPIDSITLGITQESYSIPVFSYGVTPTPFPNGVCFEPPIVIAAVSAVSDTIPLNVPINISFTYYRR